MKVDNLDKMYRGWFIGDFEPSLFRSNEFEVAVKHYIKGDYEENHYHKLATEYTVIIEGRVRMSGKDYESGTILTISPFESTDFLALTNVTTVVVKIPGVTGDKYLTKKEE